MLNNHEVNLTDEEAAAEVARVAKTSAEAHCTSAATHHQSSSVSPFAFARIKPAKINIPFWQVLELHTFGAVDG